MTSAGTVRPPCVDFDHHSQAYRDRGHEILTELREDCPVAWSDRHGGFWVVTRYEDAHRVEVDAAGFSSHQDNGGDQIPIPELPFTPVPIMLDPPEFHTYRRMLNPLFAPQAVKAMRDDIQRATDAAIDEFITIGQCDIVTDLANAVPTTTALGLLGMPVEDWRRYADAMHEILYRTPGTPAYESAVAGNEWMIEQIIRTVESRRRSPGEDLISRWVAATADGHPISDSYIHGMVWLLIAGGSETTGSLLANTLVHLGRNPELRTRLRNSPDLLPSAREEFLRYITPTQHLARTATRDVEIGGQHIRAGDRVLISLASANRDQGEFTNADELIMERKPNRHMAFGLGPHRCIGSNLGRAMFEIMLERVLARLGDYELLPGAERYPSTGAFDGYISVPVRFTPGHKIHSADIG